MTNDNLILEQLKLFNDKIDKLINILSEGGLAIPACLPKDIPCKYTFFEWLRCWLEHEHKPNVNAVTFYKDCRILERYVFSFPDYDKPLDSFKPLNLQALVNSVTASRQRVIASNMITAALYSAFNNDIILKDVTKNFKKPDHQYKEDRALLKDEESKLLKCLKNSPIEYYIKILLFAGLRRNEALGLQRKHLDFDNNEIYIEQQVNMSGNIITKLKTKLSKRKVKMFSWLKDCLINFKSLPPETRLFNFKPDLITRHFTLLCEKNKIPNFTLKSCRTTFATRCAEMGIPDIIVQVWLGHSNLKTTKKHYQKVNSEYIEREYLKATNNIKTNPYA